MHAMVYGFTGVLAIGPKSGSSFEVKLDKLSKFGKHIETVHAHGPKPDVMHCSFYQRGGDQSVGLTLHKTDDAETEVRAPHADDAEFLEAIASVVESMESHHAFRDVDLDKLKSGLT